jgi:protein-S-isoprenylcysteine O-methyltransferase Ste14
METRVPPDLVMLFAACLAWLLSRLAPSLALDVPLHRALAVVIALLGLAFSLGSRSAFKRAETTLDPLHPDHASRLVTSGLYRFTRNPMYVGQCLAIAGWCLWLDHALAWAALVAHVAFLTMFQIKPEERVLMAKFGEDYRVYCARVRRWL